MKNDIYDKIKNCSSCLLCSKEKNLPEKRILPDGFVNSNFMLIGIAPSANANPDGKSVQYFFQKTDNAIFSKNRELLKSFFENIAIDFETIWKTNVQKCIGDSNDFSINAEYFNKCFDSNLKSEIQTVKPKIIFALGNEVAKLFGADEHSKIYFNKEFECNVIKIWHPSYVLRGGTTEEKYINQCEKIYEEIKNLVVENFVNFHHHNQFSLRDGMGDEKDIAKKLCELKSPGFCLTNHGNIHAHYRQYKESKKYGLKPIFGTEIYYNNNRESIIQLLDSKNKDEIALRKKLGKDTFHLTILAKNLKGYYNLISLNNEALMNSFYRFPLIDDSLIAKYKEGLIVLSGCPGAYIPVNLFLEEELAYKKASFFKELFNDDFYIELMSTKYDVQIELNNKLLKLSKYICSNAVITNDTHYIEKGDDKYHDIMLISGTNSTLEDISDPAKKTWTFSVKDLYLKTSNDIIDDIKYLNSDNYNEKTIRDLIYNTNKLFAKIEKFDIDTSPRYPKLSDEKSEDLFFRLLSDGIKRRKIVTNEEFSSRLKEEIKIISELGYLDYFIVLQDIINWCKDKFGNSSVGPGRGSAAASLVCYLLNITDINPLKYKFMLFERFMSPGRKDPPDIDSDFSPSIRGEVINYAIEKFGRNYVFSVGVHGTIKLKMAIHDVLKALGEDYGEIIKLTKKLLLTNEMESLGIDEIAKSFPELKQKLDKYSDASFAIDKIRNKIKSFGQHAGGLVISGVDLTKTLPLAKTSSGAFVTSNTEGGDYHEITEMGFIKYDILSLTTLDNILFCDKLIKNNYNVELNWYDIIENENKYECIYSLFEKSDSFGIFQFSSDLATNYLKDLKPNSINDLCAASSLIRPGPLDQNAHIDYSKRKNNLQDFSVPDCLYPHLKDTFGLLVYQEQFLTIAQDVCKISKEDASVLRKALVKYERGVESEKRRKLKVESFKEKIIEGFINNKMNIDEANQWWDYIEAFSRYGFNFAHSLSYAISSFKQLYQKYFYTIEFYTSLLNFAGQDELYSIILNILKFKARKKINDDVIEYNISIGKPELRRMNENFIIENESIIHGLVNIKYISKENFKNLKNNFEKEDLENYEKIITKKFVCNKKNKFLIDKKTISALIFSGSLDYLGIDRKEMIETYNKIRKSSIETENDFDELERYYIGYKLSSIEKLKRIREDYFKQNPNNKPLNQILNLEHGIAYELVKIEKISKKKTKGGKKYCLLNVSDIDGNRFDIFLWQGAVENEKNYFAMFEKNNNFIKMNQFVKI